MKKLLFWLFLLAGFLLTAELRADDWYIKNFDSRIELNSDCSATVTERITADCGNAPNKHGIFRALPLFYDRGGEKIPTPVTLLSITDFNGKAHN